MNESDIKVVKEGKEAFKSELSLTWNPHVSGTREASLWREGWRKGQDESTEHTMYSDVYLGELNE